MQLLYIYCSLLQQFNFHIWSCNAVLIGNTKKINERTDAPGNLCKISWELFCLTVKSIHYNINPSEYLRKLRCINVALGMHECFICMAWGCYNITTRNNNEYYCTWPQFDPWPELQKRTEHWLTYNGRVGPKRTYVNSLNLRDNLGNCLWSQIEVVSHWE